MSCHGKTKCQRVDDRRISSSSKSNIISSCTALFSLYSLSTFLLTPKAPMRIRSTQTTMNGTTEASLLKLPSDAMLPRTAMIPNTSKTPKMESQSRDPMQSFCAARKSSFDILYFSMVLTPSNCGRRNLYKIAATKKTTSAMPKGLSRGGLRIQQLLQLGVLRHAEFLRLLVMLAGEIGRGRRLRRVHDGEIEMRLGVVGIEVDSLAQLLLGGGLPALLAAGDAEIVVRLGVLRVEREGFGQRRDSLV